MKIRTAFPLRFHHFEIPAGTVIDIPADLARMAIERSIAEPAETERAIIAPQETRGRGRPRKNYGDQQVYSGSHSGTD